MSLSSELTEGLEPTEAELEQEFTRVVAGSVQEGFNTKSTFAFREQQAAARAQEERPALALPDDEDTKAGAFKISSKAISLLKTNIGDDWKPEQALFKKQRDLVDGLSTDELADLFGADSVDKAQDLIAGQPRNAFNKWLTRASRVSPKLGKLIRATPDNAALLFYLTMVRVSGREMADVVLKRYFETESDYPGAVRARMKVEEIESLVEASEPDPLGRIKDMVDDAGEIGRTMQNRVDYEEKGKGDAAWLKTALLEEVRRMEQTMKRMRMLLEK